MRAAVLPIAAFSALFGNAAFAFLPPVLECSAVKDCSAEGDCAAADPDIDFRIRLQELTPESQFWPAEVTVDDIKHSADIVTETGPLIWDEPPSTGNFVTFVSTGVIWVRNDLIAGTSKIWFMQCEEVK